MFWKIVIGTVIGNSISFFLFHITATIFGELSKKVEENTKMR